MLLSLKALYPNVILLVTGDYDFRNMMMDLKSKGETVLLAQPRDASPNFSI